MQKYDNIINIKEKIKKLLLWASETMCEAEYYNLS